MLIKFIKPSLPYNAGEVAGFKDADAQKYIKAGVAVEYKPPRSKPKDKDMDEPPVDKMIRKGRTK